MGCDMFIIYIVSSLVGLPRWRSGKESACHCRRCKRHRSHPWAGNVPQRREWQNTPVFLPGEFHGQRSLVGHSPWGCRESDTTERLTLKKAHRKKTKNKSKQAKVIISQVIKWEAHTKKMHEKIFNITNNQRNAECKIRVGFFLTGGLFRFLFA